MKAMVLNKAAPIEKSPLKLIDIPKPEPGPKEVRLKVLCCGICRTDLHVIEGELSEKKAPLIPGHQVVGVVEKLGKNCQHLQKDQTVGIAWLRHTCSSCSYCHKSQENLCESALFTGYHADGGYAEYAIVPEDYAYVIPDTFTPVSTAPLLCAGIIGYRALKLSCVPSGGNLGLFGFGSSAHVVLQLAHHRGAKVFVISRGKKHQDFAKQMGAHWVGDNIEDIPQKLDSAILFAPVGTLVPTALQALDKGGTLALAGVYMTPVPELDYEKHLFYERKLVSVTANTRQDGIALLKEAAEIPIATHVTTYPLDMANQALQDLKTDQINGSGVLVLA